MAKILGPVVGAMIDRRDGDSGVKGAFLGYMVQSGLRAAGGLVATVAAGWAIKKVIDKVREDKPAQPRRSKKAVA